MGTFFSNIHIRKNNAFRMEELKKHFVETMTAKGYKTEDSEANAGECRVVIYAPTDSEWVSVASDEFLFTTKEGIRSQTEPLSALFGTDVIAAECEDSDYLFLNLVNTAAGTDGWINVGKQYGKNLRRTNIAAWKQSVGDYARFQQILKENYVLAEEAFYACAELLKMCPDQMGLGTDHLEGLGAEETVVLTFYAAATKIKPPKFKIPRFSLVPCTMNENTNVVSVVNKGGKSRGIAVLFLGDYVENKEITFENVTIECDYGAENRKVMPVALRIATFTDGKKAYYWEDKTYPIPPAVNQELPEMKRMKLEFEREISVRFVPKGDERKVLDIKVAIIPLANWTEGQAVWYVYQHSGSKKAYVEEHRGLLKSRGGIDPDEYEV